MPMPSQWTLCASHCILRFFSTDPDPDLKRKMVFHVLKEDSRRQILHVTGYSDTILLTGGMLEKSLNAQKAWSEAFSTEKKRVADRKEEYAKASRLKDPVEKEARLAELDRERDLEGVSHLPPPVLYPVKDVDDDGDEYDEEDDACDEDTRMRDGENDEDTHGFGLGGKGGDDGGEGGDCGYAGGEGQRSVLFFDEYDQQGQGHDSPSNRGNKRDRRRRRRGASHRLLQEDCTGIPCFPLVMYVDIQGKWTEEKSLITFQGKFGSLPARAMLEVTNMMYRTSSRNANGRETGGGRGEPDHENAEEALPEEIFLPEPRLVQMHSRMKMFKPDEFTMEGIRRAGCDAHLHERIMGVVRSTGSPSRKLKLFTEYLQRIMRQHISSVLNNDLRSNHALYTIKYLELAKFQVCACLCVYDLCFSFLAGVVSLTVCLVRCAMTFVCSSGAWLQAWDRSCEWTSLHPKKLAILYTLSGRNHMIRCFFWGLLLEEAVPFRVVLLPYHLTLIAQEAKSASYWHLNSPCTFLEHSWLMDDLLREHNERFFYLTPQNFRICNDMWVGMVQFRLGQHDDWAYMGMTTVICDAAMKVRRAPNGFNTQGNADGIPTTDKKTSAGLDLDCEAADCRRTSYNAYLKGWQQKEDAQKLTKLRRTSEGGLQVLLLICLIDESNGFIG